jgi:RNA polymerase sigma-70 factor (ECF subfamily)
MIDRQVDRSRAKSEIAARRTVVSRPTPLRPRVARGVRAGAPITDLFRSIYDAWFGKVRRWTRVLTGDNCDADDLAQNVFLIVYRRLSDFDGENLGGWLFTITVNQVRDHRRLAWTRARVNDSESAFEGMESMRPTPSTALETGEKIEALAHIVARLNAGPRAAFLLFALDQYTCKEIASMQRIPINTVHCQIKRSRNAVVAQLAKWPGLRAIEARRASGRRSL